ncbi:MAG: FtsH protease activity modulator HflK, partial [Gammaproteobacteria bacterium]|nr:FtsH protease activity modulator HflK [Gammaproteobacteria bacterium]
RALGRFLGAGGGRGGRGGRGAPVLLALAIGVLVWIGWPGSGWYQVGPEQQGVVLRFGAFERSTPPGFAFKLPIPFERVLLPNVTQVNTVDIGDSRDGMVGARRAPTDTDSLMLTGDENIVDLSFTVQWIINTEQTADYLFNLDDPDEAVRAVAESAMREIIGQTSLQRIISEEIAGVSSRVQDKIQETLDAYRAGVTITDVLIQRPTLPEADNPADRGNVERDPRAAFLDVENAEQEKQESIQRARAYANSEVPEARGRAQAIVEAARAYRDAVIAEASGDAERFNLIYDQYRLAPDVTRRRMFLETMEQVLQRSNKVILDEGASGTGVVPYLPLNELRGAGGAAGGGR